MRILRIFGIPVCRPARDRIKELESEVASLRKALEDTAPQGPHMYVPNEDGYTYVYQCVGRILTPHWSDSMR